MFFETKTMLYIDNIYKNSGNLAALKIIFIILLQTMKEADNDEFKFGR